MVTVQNLNEITERGVKLWVEHGKLKFDAPQSWMSVEHMDWLKTNKAQIINLLQIESNSQPKLDKYVPQPASAAQQRFWLAQKISNDGSVFNIPLALKLTGQLDKQALAQSIEAIYQRHDVLRSKLFEQGSVIYQQVMNARNLVVNYQSMNESQLQCWIEQQLAHSFDLSEDVLISASIVELGEQQYVLFINMHHAVSDGWSLGNFARELLAFYTAKSNGKLADVPPLPCQYGDYSALNHNLDMSEDINYWRTHLADAPVCVELSTDFPRKLNQSLQCHVHSLALSDDLTKRLSIFCKQHRLTQFNVLFAIYNLMLSKYTGEHDLLIGVPVSGRGEAEIENLIGCFINNLVMRNNVNPRMTFEQLVNNIQQNTLSAFKHQHVSFDTLVEKLNPPRVEVRQPFFQTMFVLQNEMMPAASLPNLDIESLEWTRRYTQYELTLRLEVQQGNIQGYIEYASELFSEQTIKRLGSLFITLLDQALTNPQAMLYQYDIFDNESYNYWIKEWNNSENETPVELSTGQVFSQVVAKFGQRPAVTSGNQTLSYKELDVWADSIAQYLGTNWQPQQVVGVCLSRSLYLAASLLGVLKAGLVYLPLDPQQPPERIKKMIAQANVQGVITCDEFADRFNGLNVQVIGTLILEHLQEQPIIDYVPRKVSSIDPAYLIFTSGSTGEPKGTLVSHSNLVNYAFAQNERLALNERDVLLQLAAIGFDVFFEEVMGAWFAGSQLVFRNEHDLLIRAVDMLAFVELHAISCINLTTAHWHTIVQEMKDANLTPPESLRWVIIGGEAVQPDKLAYWKTLNIPLFHLYGQTEVCCDSTSYTYDPAISDVTSLLPIGTAIANSQVYVLDDFLRPVPIGSYGEIYIGGAGVAIGYIGAAKLTAEKFIPDPFSNKPGSRLCRTGDRGRINFQGQLEFAGRIDSQVKIRGYRIELAEIEAVLSKHTSIDDVVVSVVLTENDKQLVAYYVTEQKDENLVQTLRNHIKSMLPSYNVPAYFVCLERIPLNVNGKVDRKILPVPDITHLSASKDVVAPQNELEQNIHDIWSEYLDLDTVSTDGNFFDLGGHSLTMSRIAGRLEQLTGLTIQLSQLFDEQTIQEQAQLILNLQLSSIDEAELLSMLDEL